MEKGGSKYIQLNHGERAKELPRGSAHHNTFKNYKMEFDFNVGSSRFVLAEK